MGASDSYPDCTPKKFIEHFKDFIEYINDEKISNKSIKNYLKTLGQVTDRFLQSFDLCVRRKRLTKDISPYFKKIDEAINSFQKCAEYIIENQHEPGAKVIKKSFQNDISSFIKQLIDLENFTLKIVQTLQDKVYLSYIEYFYTELSIFDFSLTVESLEVPPYYHMSFLPAYSLHNQILSSKQRCINVIGPHGTGKTTLVPIFLACKLLSQSSEMKSKSRKLKFVVIVENDSTLIYKIEECYNKLKKNKAIPIKTKNNDFLGFGGGGEEEDDDEIDDDEIDEEDECLLVTSSYQKVIGYSKSQSTIPVIAILSPLQTLQLTRNVEGFSEKAVFIIDNANQRSIETDVLVQDLSIKIERFNDVNRKGKITLLSTIADASFLRAMNHYENLEFTLELEEPAEQVTVQCSSYESIGKKNMFTKMCSFFDTWITKKRYTIGSSIVFVPTPRIAKKIIKGIFQKYSKGDSYKVVILQTRIMKGEAIDTFNERLLNDIKNAAIERSADPKAASERDSPIPDDILFILPIDMTGIVTDEEKDFIESKLPLQITKAKFVRLIFCSNKNESYMRVPDLTVIFDSGLTEVEYYNIDKGISCYREEMLPLPFIEQRHKLLGNCPDGVHFIFNVKDEKRPLSIQPPVKRCDMSQSILRLRGIGIKFEKQLNLPDEPNHQICDAGVNLLKRLEIIDTDSGELTEIGKIASKFSFVSPFFALATAKFTENHEFAFLVSLVIERSVDLIENSQSQLLYDHFCPDSDVVTIIESILALNTEGDHLIDEKAVKLNDSGFSAGSLYSIYTLVANTFDKTGNDEGRKTVVSSIQWAQTQPGGILGMIDKYVNLLDQNNFLNLRKGIFQYVVGTGPGCEPTLVYKANDIFKFDGTDEAHIKFSKRPGWLGLQSPGNIIVLSLQIEESNKLNRGLLIHRDPSQIGVNPGVVSQQEKNPSLNSYFFTALFDAYWSGQPTANNFIGIYHSNKPKKETAFLINICERNNQTYINYCPRNATVKDEMNRAIPLLSKLMPFVPRSIIVKSEIPLCAVEVITYGASSNYESNLYQIDDPNKKNPIPYPITKALLEYAGTKINDLQATHPLIRFSITGESVYYMIDNDKRQSETTFAYPDADPTITSVFHPSHSSHMFFLVDYDYADKPAGVPQLQWLPPADAGVGTVGSNDTNELELIVNISTKMLNGLGQAKRAEDIFYITLDGGFPTVQKGEIPPSIQNFVGYCEKEQGAIKQGIDKLVYQFTKMFSKNMDLTDPITVTELGSTNQCTKYPTDEVKQNTLNQIDATLSAQLHLENNDIESIFCGNSMICLKINNLPPNLTTHPKSKNVFNDDYQQCQADVTIENALKGIGIPVTKVIHEPSVNITVYHLPRLCLSKEEFEESVQNIVEKFGFLLTLKPHYIFHEEADPHGIIGDMTISLIGQYSCVALASCVLKEFPVVSGSEDDYDLTMTRTKTAQSTMRTLRDLDPRLGRIPKVNIYTQKAIRIPKAEIDSVKDLFKQMKGYKINDNYRVLIIPCDDEEEVLKKMAAYRNEKLEIACFMGCDLDEPDVLPQYVYLYEKDGTVKPQGVCKGCILSIFENDADIQMIYNPVTHLIDQTKLIKIPEPLKAFQIIDSYEVDGEYWPQVPFGQLIWAFMSDLTNQLPPYVKAWFTIIVEFAIQFSRNYIFCPNHPTIPIPLPEAGRNVKCAMCDMMYCAECLNWHPLDFECHGADMNIKKCPWCHAPGEKVSGCNRITCPRCGNSWCYQCMAGFKTAQECYDHMTAVGHW